MREKYSIYEKYISRLEIAYNAEYYFESAWLSYVLLEDRLVSILNITGGSTNQNGNSIRMMGPKIVEIENRMTTNLILKNQLDAGQLINLLREWKDDRNDLMHSMVDSGLSINEIELKINDLAKRGHLLVRKFAACARRLKTDSNKGRI